MSSTGADRQKAYRKRKKAGSKRLDLLIPIADMELFIKKVKQSKLTRVEFFAGLLRGNRSLEQTTFTPNDKEQEQTATIDRLQAEIDNLRTDNHVIIKLNKQKDKEITELKEFGAPKVSKSEVNELKKIMSDKEVAYHSITGDLKAEIKKLKEKPPECQAIKRDGKQCGKLATHEVKENKRLIHLCSTHHNT